MLQSGRIDLASEASEATDSPPVRLQMVLGTEPAPSHDALHCALTAVGHTLPSVGDHHIVLPPRLDHRQVPPFGRASLPTLRLRAALARRPDPRAGRDALIEQTAHVLKIIASPKYPPDDAVLRQQIARDIDRAYHPPGYVRQLLAILASGSRVPILGQITAPTLVMHGTADPLVPPAAAPDLHRRIRGSRLETFDGTG